MGMTPLSLTVAQTSQIENLGLGLDCLFTEERNMGEYLREMFSFHYLCFLIWCHRQLVKSVGWAVRHKNVIMNFCHVCGLPTDFKGRFIQKILFLTADGIH